jgi:hypothetical protein
VTVRELVEKLQALSQDMPIVVSGDTGDGEPEPRIRTLKAGDVIWPGNHGDWQLRNYGLTRADVRERDERPGHVVLLRDAEIIDL